MEVQFTADVQAKLDRFANETGRAQDQLIHDALAGYFDELLQLRGMLDSRFDDLKSGKVLPIPSEAVLEHFRQKSAARRS